MLNIAQICNRPHGSVGNIVLSATKGFTAYGHAVTNIFLKGEIDSHLESNLDCEFASCLEPWTRHGKHAVADHLKSLLQKKSFDVILAHCYHPCKFAAHASSNLRIKRKIAIFHGIGNLKRLRRKLFAWLFLKDWLFAGVSEAVAQDIIHSRAVLRPGRVRVVSNGIDLKALEAKQVSRNAAREFLGLSFDDLVVGHVGRLSRSKNQDVIIEAFARMATNLPSSRLVIIGQGRRESELRSLISTLGLGERVILKGYVPNAQLYLKAFDLFLFPSRTEAFGLALLEAMVARIPVIVSNVDGITELVGNYPHKIQPDDVQSLARLMVSIATQSAQQRKRIADELYARAVEKYDIKQMEDSYLELIA